MPNRLTLRIKIIVATGTIRCNPFMGKPCNPPIDVTRMTDLAIIIGWDMIRRFTRGVHAIVTHDTITANQTMIHAR